MTACRHKPRYPELHAAPSKEDAVKACAIVANHPAHDVHPRAVTVPEGNQTLIDAEFWKTLGPATRAAVVAHERAHAVLGLQVSCEGCADKVGGYLMRSWGYSTDLIADAFAQLGCPRDASAGALEGAKAATQGLAARGLLGKTPLDQRAALVKERMTTTTPTKSKGIPSPSAADREQTRTAFPTVDEKGPSGVGGLAPTAFVTDFKPGAPSSRVQDFVQTTAASGQGPAPAQQGPVTDAPTTPAPTSPETAPVENPVDDLLALNEEDRRSLKVQIIAGIVVALVLAVGITLLGKAAK